MNKTCKMCGHNGEVMWRDGKYYCRYCGSEIDVTQQDSNTNCSFSATSTINAVCPICKNANNNTFENGKYRCALCGTSFNVSQQEYNSRSNINTQNDYYISTKRAELEKEKNNKLLWGIVFIFLFWPISIYHFYKMHQISTEISKLTSQ